MKIAPALPRLLTAAALLSGASPSTAHDYWLEPSSFRMPPGTRVSVFHRVGERFVGEPVPRNPFAIVRFDEIDPSGAIRSVEGVDGLDPAGWFVSRRPGKLELVYQSRPSYVELDAATFATYLREEGLEWVSREREELGQGEAVAREAFSRSAKAWTCVGGEPRPEAARPIAHGLELEVVANRDPCDASAGEELEFRLLRDGKPAAGVLTRALLRPSPPLLPASPTTPSSTILEARTDAGGRFRFRLPLAGVWLIKGVQMERLVGDPKADWRSRWASLTFDLRESAP
jgi:uncharacterized GH25 family protein